MYDQLDQQQLNALNIDLGVEQSGGAPFNFEFQTAGFRKSWKKTADKQRYEATLKQTRTPSQGDNIGKEITNALARQDFKKCFVKKVSGDRLLFWVIF